MDRPRATGEASEIRPKQGPHRFVGLVPDWRVHAGNFRPPLCTPAAAGVIHRQGIPALPTLEVESLGPEPARRLIANRAHAAAQGDHRDAKVGGDLAKGQTARGEDGGSAAGAR
jgi:hypothetical protein